MKPRIGIAGLSCECCMFSPLLSTAGDFLQQIGADLLSAYPFLVKHSQVEFVPLIRIRALPGGAIDPGFYDEFIAQLLKKLKADGPWDGLFLPMHGAANVHGRQDLEGEILTVVREVVGPDCLIAASYDLHGNISDRVARHLDILTAYRTAPHVDWFETLERACTLLVHCIHRGVKPHLAFVPVPILLPGEMTSTEFEPARSLYASIPQVIEKYNILDASILIGYAWADESRASGSVIAVGLDPGSTQAAAHELAGAFWQARHRFRFGVPAAGVDESIRAAMAATVTPVIISDSGDNPTAGGAGDMPYVLERLIILGAENTLCAGIADAPAVENCFRMGTNATTSLQLGGKLDPIHAKPLNVNATILSLHTVPWSLGRSPNRVAVIQIQGVTVVITQRRTTFHRESDFTQLYLDPRTFSIIVVKIGYLEPELATMARTAFLALSPGAVNQNIVGLEHKHIHRPMFPLDPDMSWELPTQA